MSKQSEMVMLIMSMGISENIQDVIGDKLTIIENKQNKGLALSLNDGIEACKNYYVLE